MLSPSLSTLAWYLTTVTAGLVVLGATLLVRPIRTTTGFYLRRAGIGRRLATVAVLAAIAGPAIPAAAGVSPLEETTVALLGVVPYLTGIGLVTVAVGRKRQYDHLRAATLVESGPLPREGPVAISGEARTGDATVSAPSGEPCLAYDARREREFHDLRTSISAWLVTDRRVESTPFRVVAGTTEVAVDPAEGSLRLSADARAGDGTSADDASDAVGDASGAEGDGRKVGDGSVADGRLLDEAPAADGGRRAGFSPFGRRRTTERRLADGDHVTVIGTARTPPGERARVEGPGLLVTDRPLEWVLYDLERTVGRNGRLGAVLALGGCLAMVGLSVL